MKHISTTITKAFFEMKMRDLEESGHFIEFKDDSSFWHKRMQKLPLGDCDDVDIVFLVGNKPYRFKVAELSYVHRDFIPPRYVSAIKTEYAYAIKCVKAVV